jgi:hypothetical protein
VRKAGRDVDDVRDEGRRRSSFVLGMDSFNLLFFSSNDNGDDEDETDERIGISAFKRPFKIRLPLSQMTGAAVSIHTHTNN